ncbi:carbohydrate ABC transporter permease [Microbacterium sp. 179-I 1D1 NHS]|uniref:carbohydrate ABC transporter permease n=1 Tax=Microbacterium sp. 179-I 1D1 NHS TaxID=3374298 RepID=UPI00387A6ACB
MTALTFRTRDRIRFTTRSIIMIGLTAAMALPLYYVVVSTFKTQAEMAASPFGLPSTWRWENYATLLMTGSIWQSFLNTLVVTAVSVLFQVLVGSMAAYGMILRRSRLTAAIGAVMLIAFCIPMQATLIPLYQLEAQLGLVNSLTGLIIIYLGGAIFCYFLIVGYMRKLPSELLEAARIDGAGPFRIYGAIVLPLIRPILTTVIVFQTLGTWNDFVWPNLLLSSNEKRTIVLQVYNAMGQFTTDWPQFMTVTVIALVPVFIFYLFCQRWIVAGLVAGSVKG